jgi:hypothetical protein
VHSVWAPAFRPRKQSLGVQTLCIIVMMMFAAPALANTDATALSPLEDSASCTLKNENESLANEQSQAADAALPAGTPNSSLNAPSVQEGR